MCFIFTCTFWAAGLWGGHRGEEEPFVQWTKEVRRTARRDAGPEGYYRDVYNAKSSRPSRNGVRVQVGPEGISMVHGQRVAEIRWENIVALRTFNGSVYLTGGHALFNLESPVDRYWLYLTF